MPCIIFLYENFKKYLISPFKGCLFLVFCLFYFLFVSYNSLHVVLHTYICNWNTFQYKYFIQSASHVVKLSFPRKIDKYFPFAKSNLCENSYTHKAIPNFSVCFRYKIIWYLVKVNKKVETKRVSNLVEFHCLCLGFMSFNIPLVYSLKRLINYCFRICSILCMIFKKWLFLKALYRPLFRKYAHCKPLFQFYNYE